jgi:hypothetical protein
VTIGGGYGYRYAYGGGACVESDGGGGMHMVKECVLNRTEVEGMDMMGNDA